MCHDTRTADRFYTISLNPTQAMEVRSLFQAALEGEDQIPQARATPQTQTRVGSQDHQKQAKKRHRKTSPSLRGALHLKAQWSSNKSPAHHPRILTESSSSSSSSGMGQKATLSQTPSKRPPLESKEHPTPSKLHLTDRRSVVVYITPMKISPLKLKSKPTNVSPIMTQQGMRQLRSTNARLRRAIASRRLKMENKPKETVPPHRPERKEEMKRNILPGKSLQGRKRDLPAGTCLHCHSVEPKGNLLHGTCLHSRSTEMIGSLLPGTCLHCGFTLIVQLLQVKVSDQWTRWIGHSESL
ncbi:uncharacterized protein LOC109615520 [Esox lucius]|uniref:uncharacterized protein LOC109615520 n=1 Tax=Esox lucius TaxID=8010 RepID=UPI0010BDC229|nr:uncharacterized protein LOC109615520 [Esox lucius]XP_034145381.1 uncharacterized protein LOC109615520 [Esox lucius]